MDLEQYRTEANKLIDFICEYRKNVDKQRVIPSEDIKADFLLKTFTDDAPEKGESFENIMKDFKEKIMPGLVHFNHRNFHAYFPGGESFPSLLADMLCTASNQLSFSWKSSPAATEHEQVTLNMFAKALHLPDFFIYDSKTPATGGGVLQGSASDCVMLALLTARARAVKLLKERNREHINQHDSFFLPTMVAYTSEEAHSCVQKAAKVAIIRLRVLPTDANGSLRGDELAKAIKHDIEVEKLLPIFVSATIGTTGTCAFDRIDEIGRVCINYPSIWLHVDGAYAGNSLLLPEMSHLRRGFEYIHSFNTNPNKFLVTSFDCSCFWVRKVKELKEAMVVSPTYLEKGQNEGEDLRHFGIPLSRRFRSLKLWSVLRVYGLEALRGYMRNHIELAKHFAQLIKSDHRFILVNEPRLGLVCFRLNIPNVSNDLSDKINAEFLQRMNKSGQIHMVPTTFKSRYVIRFCVNKENVTKQEIDENFEKIQNFAKTTMYDFSQKQLGVQRIGLRAFQPRFSYTKHVSTDDYDHYSKDLLRDGTTPFLMSHENSELAEMDPLHDEISAHHGNNGLATQKCQYCDRSN